MRVIIAGSREINDAGRLNRAILAAQFDITAVISGHCSNSPDMLGEAWAKRQDPVVTVDQFPADWDGLGKRAGMVRNCAMVKDGRAEGLIALWDGHSSGTRHMIQEAVGAGLRHYIDAACPHCGTTQNVGLYVFQDDRQEQLRATCRACLVERLNGAGAYGQEALAFFDVFGIWGKHTLHVTLPRVKPAQPKKPLPLPPGTAVPVKFGQRKLRPRDVKSIRPLPPRDTGQQGLFA